MSTKYLTIFLLLIISEISAISISTTGSWSLDINSGDVVSGAGGDLTSQYLSNANAISLDVTGALSDTDNWEIHVHKEDVLWHGSLSLGLLRTSDGAGTGSITGGNSLFLDLTAIDQYLFEGAGDRSSVDLQLRLSGVSVLVPSDNYSTTVYFTIIDTP